MDLHAQMIIDEFKENQKSFQIIKDVVLKNLKKIVASLGGVVNSVEARIKTVNSLQGKLSLKGYKYKTLQDITDLVGARVVTFYGDEVEKYAARIEEIFKVDWENTIDKRNLHNIDQFGYMSLHYIVRIPETLFKDERYPLVNELRIEIQLRSVLQHTWATIYHDTGYKSDVEIPKVYLRELNCLAGLLELADKQFMAIRDSIGEYRRKIKNVVSSGNLNDIELTADSFDAYLENGGFERLNKRIASINNIEIENVSLRKFILIFKKLGIQTLKQLDDLVKDNSDDAYNLAVRQFGKFDIDIMTNATGPFLVASLHSIKRGGRENEIVDILSDVYGARSSNKSYAKRVIEICKNMGLIKEEDE